MRFLRFLLPSLSLLAPTLAQTFESCDVAPITRIFPPNSFRFTLSILQSPISDICSRFTRALAATSPFFGVRATHIDCAFSKHTFLTVIFVDDGKQVVGTSAAAQKSAFVFAVFEAVGRFGLVGFEAGKCKEPGAE